MQLSCALATVFPAFGIAWRPSQANLVPSPARRIEITKLPVLKLDYVHICDFCPTATRLATVMYIDGLSPL